MSEEEKKSDTPEDNKEEDNSSSISMVDAANEAAQRIEDANKVHEELVQREEVAKTEEILGGKSEAGTIPEKPKELTDAEYAEAFQRGEVKLFD